MTTSTNNPATGKPTISGTAQVGNVLTADTSAIMDDDGVPSTLTYHWVSVDSDGTSNETNIGTNSVNYTVATADVGKKIRVKVSFTDDGGNSEGPLTSDAYPSSGTVLAAVTPTVFIFADKTSAVFKEDSITYTLTRTGATTNAMTVAVTLTQDKDYLATADLTKSVAIPAGQTTMTFTVAASSFQHFAAGTQVTSGTLTATVVNGADYDLGTPTSDDVAIVIGPTIRIEQAVHSVGEAAGTLTDTLVARTGAGAPQPTSTTGATRFTEGSSATADVDFTQVSSGVQFAAAAFSSIGGVWEAETTRTVSITNDAIDEDDETFFLKLERSGGANMSHWWMRPATPAGTSAPQR